MRGSFFVCVKKMCVYIFLRKAEMEVCEGIKWICLLTLFLPLFLSCEEDDAPSEKDRTVIWGIKKLHYHFQNESKAVHQTLNTSPDRYGKMN